MKEEKKTIKATPRRRQIIWDELQNNGAISLATLNKRLESEKLEKISRPTLYEDINYIKANWGGAIKKSQDREGDATFVLTTNYSASTQHMRSRLNLTEKKKIARLLGGLVLAHGPDSSLSNVQVPNLRIQNPYDTQDSAEIYTAAEIREFLSRPLNLIRDPKNNWGSLESIANAQLNTLLERLQNWWRTTGRTFCVDAGSTNSLFAEMVLSQIKLPLAGLFRLTIWTNNLSAFYTLAFPQIDGVEIVTVAGSPQKKSGSLGGFLAKKTLEVINPRFGMAIIGCTSVVFEDGEIRFGADDDSDAAIKTEFLNRATLRILVADSSKWSYSSYSGYHHFASPGFEGLNLVVTDEILESQLMKLIQNGTYVLASKINPDPK